MTNNLLTHAVSRVESPSLPMALSAGAGSGRGVSDMDRVLRSSSLPRGKSAPEASPSRRVSHDQTIRSKGSRKDDVIMVTAI